jgi:putative peptidoglycan lipid II flippase
MLMLNIPAMVGLVLLAHPIVSMLLERGHFGPTDTAATAAALMCYAPGLIGYSAVKIASPTFYSLGDSRTPVIASAVAVAANLALNLTLVRVLGFRGLALGTAIAAMLNATILLVWLRQRLNGLDARRNVRAIAAILVASIAMGIAVWFTQQVLESAVAGRGTLVRAFRVFTSIAAGMIVLTWAARLLRIEEFDEALDRVASRLIGGSLRG